jgi:alpha-L-fucosidase
MQPWFEDAKLGIFVHWGIYAVDGVQESWSFYDDIVPHDRYMSQLDRFTAARYDPRDWARLFARAGARYAVLTSRHPDGVALWDTAYGELNVGRDLIAGYAEALREQGLKVGLSYSHSDWNHPDYASTRKPGRPPEPEDNRYSEVAAEFEDLQAWERFLAYRDGQIRELTRRCRPDLMWFDGDWDRSEEQWRIPALAALIRSEVPDVVFNARMLSEGDVSVLGSGTELPHQVTGGLHETPGILWITPPAAADLDPHATVPAVELDGELELYGGGGRFRRRRIDPRFRHRNAPCRGSPGCLESMS